MSLYYFDVFNDDVTIDEEGIDLPGPGAAVARAKSEVLALAADSVLTHGHLILDHRVQIRDMAGVVVANVRFGDVVEVR